MQDFCFLIIFHLVVQTLKISPYVYVHWKIVLVNFCRVSPEKKDWYVKKMWKTNPFVRCLFYTKCCQIIMSFFLITFHLISWPMKISASKCVIWTTIIIHFSIDLLKNAQVDRWFFSGKKFQQYDVFVFNGKSSDFF